MRSNLVPTLLVAVAELECVKAYSVAAWANALAGSAPRARANPRRMRLLIANSSRNGNHSNPMGPQSEAKSQELKANSQ